MNGAILWYAGWTGMAIAASADVGWSAFPGLLGAAAMIHAVALVLKRVGDL